jgi:hypothetical protein
MSSFPKYSLRGLEGRKMMGIDECLVIVEGESDVRVYRRFIDDRSRILPVEDIAGTRSNNRGAIVSMSEDYPQHSFIVDEDMISLSEGEFNAPLPQNLATTWKLNDIESWAFRAMERGEDLPSIGLNDEDVRLALHISRAFGILRIITKRMWDEGGESRWRIDFNRSKELLIKHSTRLDINSNIVEMVVKTQSRDTVSSKRWQKKFRSLESEFSSFENLPIIAGHDLSFFLYYISSKRKKQNPTMMGYRDFERLLINKSLNQKNREFWGELMQGKIGIILGFRK